jgi:hypothetical protein
MLTTLTMIMPFLPQLLLKDPLVGPGYQLVTSVLSPLNANPLRQTVITYSLPNS